jgi:hypothetical protein
MKPRPSIQRTDLIANIADLLKALPTEALLGLFDDLTEPKEHDPRCTCPTCSGFAPAEMDAGYPEGFAPRGDGSKASDWTDPEEPCHRLHL